MTWTCDGEPKNSSEQYNGGGPHSPYDNDGQICMMCGLPKEAMAGQTRTGGGGSGGGLPIKPILMAVAGVLVIGGGGFGLYKAFSGGKTPDISQTPGGGTSTTPGTTPSPGDFLSSKAVSALLISQGEKILITGGKADAEKQAGATAFVGKNWDDAIANINKQQKPTPTTQKLKFTSTMRRLKKQEIP